MNTNTGIEGNPIIKENLRFKNLPVRLLKLLFQSIQIIRERYCVITLPYRNRLIIKSVACNHPNPGIRKRAFELLGAQIGERTHFNPGIRIVNDYPDDKLLIIGKDVSIAPGVIFICNSGPNPDSPLSTKNEYVKNKLIKAQEIVIEDDAWIGAGAIILPGVRIGRGAVIGAGAVVTRDIPEYSIAVGVPAKPTKDIRSYNNEKERLT